MLLLYSIRYEKYVRKQKAKKFPEEKKKASPVHREGRKTRHPLFSLAQEAQRKKLTKEKHRRYFALCGGQGGPRALHLASF
jgi:hypothetical protein